MSDVGQALKQHGKTKRSGRRQLLLLAAGGVLLVVFIMRKKSATAQAAVPAATDPTALPAGGGGAPATFADNGAQAATLGSDITNSLSGLQTSLDAQTSAFQDFTSQLGQVGTAVPVSSSPTSPAAAGMVATDYVPPAAPTDNGMAWGSTPPSTPAGNVGQPAYAPAATVSHAAAATAPGSTHVNTQASNPRQGQTYTVQPAKGGVYHVYAGGQKIFVKK